MEDVKKDLPVVAGFLFDKIDDALATKQYNKALADCELLKTTLPYESDDMLKRRNITTESVLLKQYRAYYFSNTDAQKTKEAGNQLIAMNYKLPFIYTSMTRLALSQKDTVLALATIEKGLALFDNNADLYTLQIDILIAQKKNDLLLQKLESAVEVSPDNDNLHGALAGLYEKLKNIDKAEAEYLKTIEINPKNEFALFNLGNMYFNQGNEWNKKLNELPPKETAKAKEYEAKSDGYFKKAVVYFEQYFQINPDAAVKQRLRLLFTRLGEPEKAAKYK